MLRCAQAGEAPGLALRPRAHGRERQGGNAVQSLLCPSTAPPAPIHTTVRFQKDVETQTSSNSFKIMAFKCQSPDLARVGITLSNLPVPVPSPLLSPPRRL